MPAHVGIQGAVAIPVEHAVHLGGAHAPRLGDFLDALAANAGLNDAFFVHAGVYSTTRRAFAA